MMPISQPGLVVSILKSLFSHWILENEVKKCESKKNIISLKFYPEFNEGKRMQNHVAREKNRTTSFTFLNHYS